ncbi:trans-sialidase, putative, partial [Trypanosoma cruzi]
TACDDGRRRVYESGDKGEEWTEALGTLSRVWGNNQKRHEWRVRSGFITANIDGVESNRNVMLVTLPVFSKKADTGGNGKEKGELHLWLTDNTHIVDIGPVSDDDDAAASSLLYRSGDNKQKELIALYEKKKDDEEKPSLGMVSVLLTAQLERVNKVLATWKEVDDRVSKLCPSEGALKDVSSDTACSTVKSTDPSVVEWKDKLMMMTACDDGRRRVYESGDKGEEWTEALGTLSRVWGNNQKRHEWRVRSGFITANIDGVESNRNVMLVTLPVFSKKADTGGNGKEKGELHLWLTDNTHIVDIGPVSDDDDAAASSLLYRSGDNKQKELIALYEKKKDDEEKPSLGMVSVLLTAQLERVNKVLATWKEVDDRVSKLCPSEGALKDVSSDTACSTVKITAGLVGFLSGNFSDNTW